MPGTASNACSAHHAALCLHPKLGISRREPPRLIWSHAQSERHEQGRAKTIGKTNQNEVWRLSGWLAPMAPMAPNDCAYGAYGAYGAYRLRLAPIRRRTTLLGQISGLGDHSKCISPIPQNSSKMSVLCRFLMNSVE